MVKRPGIVAFGLDRSLVHQSWIDEVEAGIEYSEKPNKRSLSVNVI
jgi:hypothetical protein